MRKCVVAVMVHCRERSDEMIVGDLSHMHIYEQGGSAQVRSTCTSSAASCASATLSAMTSVDAGRRCPLRHGNNPARRNL